MCSLPLTALSGWTPALPSFVASLPFPLLLHRVDAAEEDLPRLVVLVPHFLQRDFGIGAERHELRHTLKSVLPTPELASSWRNAQIETMPVAELVWSVF